MNAFGIRVIMKRLKAIRFMMADRSVPKRKKALIIFGIAYIFFPIDLIPPIFFPLSLIDDLCLWGFYGICQTNWISIGLAAKLRIIQKNIVAKPS